MSIATYQQFANVLSPTPITLMSAITSGGLSIVVSSALNLPAQGPFKIGIQDSATSIPEYILIADINGTTLTVDTSGRGIGGSVAAAHNADAIIQQILLKEDINAMFPSGDADTLTGAAGTWDTALKKVALTSTSGGGDYTIDPTTMVSFQDYTLKDAANSFVANPVTLRAAGSATIDLLTDGVLLNSNGASITIWSDGTNLWVKNLFLGV